MKRMNGIRFTQNTHNTRSFGKFLAGNLTRRPAPVAWLPVGRRSSYQVTSAMSILFSQWMSVLLEIEIPCIMLFLNRNRISQNSPRRMHPKITDFWFWIYPVLITGYMFLPLVWFPGLPVFSRARDWLSLSPVMSFWRKFRKVEIWRRLKIRNWS